MVVELLEYRRKDLLDVAIVDGPAHDFVQRRGQMQAQGEGVSMDAASGITFRRTSKMHGAIQREFFPDAVVNTIVTAARGGGLVNGNP